MRSNAPLLSQGDALNVVLGNRTLNFVCIFAGQNKHGERFYNMFDDNGRILTFSEDKCVEYLNLGAKIILNTDLEDFT